MEPQNQVPQYQAPQPNQYPASQSMSKQKKMIMIISFGILGLIVLVSIILGITQTKHKKHGPTSIIPAVNETQLQSRDVERETDIKAMHGQIEAYWAQNGFYPTLANMNDTTFINTYLKGLDVGALQDPYGSDTKLVASPQEDAYAYDVIPDKCENVKTLCTSYTLTATLEGDINGSDMFEKRSLN